MHNLKHTISLEWLATKLDCEFVGDNTCKIDNISDVDNSKESSLIFSKKIDSKMAASIIISNANDFVGYNQIISSNPRLDFIRAIQILDREVGFECSINVTDICPTVTIGKNVVIEDGVSIGSGTIIEHNATILKGTVIGKNCIIRSGAVVGSEGFGFDRDSNGWLIRFKHLGGVVIGNEVEIGANTCISRGTLSDTFIGDNVKIDNLVHVAHNCKIGRSTIITACAELSGGVDVGEECWIAPNVSIKEKIKIESGSLVGIGAVVTKTVQNSDIVFGNPAKSLRRKKFD
ncbi:hypothetical protein AB6C45_20435 [Vibrio splendidus]